MSSSDELLNQLLHDESFFRWVHRADPQATARWDTWLAEHPEHRATVEDAARMLRGIAFVPKRLPEAHLHQEWTRLQARLPELAESPQPIHRRTWLRAAAVAAILLVSGALAWWGIAHQPTKTTYATDYGETLDITLPDGSRATLNANSELVYWETNEPRRSRKVQLTGEAFFDVIHREASQSIPFIVRTPDLLVQVLGTEFNVNTRRGRTQVVLDGGRVELQLPTEERAAMLPGELVEYQAAQDEVHRATVNTELFIAWRNRRLKFDDTPLAEVAQRLEENYGVSVRFDEPLLRRKRVTGEVSARELDTILLALSRLFDISVQRSGNTVRIARHYVSP